MAGTSSTVWEWQQAYVAAVLEVDETKLTERIDQAEEAITRRLLGDGNLDKDEAQNLMGAVLGLRALRTERLKRDSAHGKMSSI